MPQRTLYKNDIGSKKISKYCKQTQLHSKIKFISIKFLQCACVNQFHKSLSHRSSILTVFHLDNQNRMGQTNLCILKSLYFIIKLKYIGSSIYSSSFFFFFFIFHFFLSFHFFFPSFHTTL